MCQTANNPAPKHDSSTNNQELLTVHTVSKQFGGVRALHCVSLSLMSNEILGLIGPNGAGKTTLFNVISGHQKHDAGQILLRRCDISRLRPHQRCHLGLARTFQITRPFLNLSVLENIIIGAYFGHKKSSTLAVAREQAHLILETVGLSLPMQLASTLTLSERRRLELARALATGPSALLLDEVMAGLTLSESRELSTIIQRIREDGIAIMFVEHVLPMVVEIADRVIVLDRGEVIAEGSPTKVMIDERVVTAYLGSNYALT